MESVIPHEQRKQQILQTRSKQNSFSQAKYIFKLSLSYAYTIQQFWSAWLGSNYDRQGYSLQIFELFGLNLLFC